jgi:hypothetical protein
LLVCTSGDKFCHNPTDTDFYFNTNIFAASLRSKLKTHGGKNSILGGRKSNRSNNSGQQTRAVMRKALSYSLAFFLAYLFPIIISIRTLAGYLTGETLSVLARIFFPLQGFFNFIVFIHPKVVQAKNSANRRNGGEAISWFAAFVKVVTAKGQQHDDGLNQLRSPKRMSFSRRLSFRDDSGSTTSNMKECCVIM